MNIQKTNLSKSLVASILVVALPTMGLVAGCHTQATQAATPKTQTHQQSNVSVEFNQLDKTDQRALTRMAETYPLFASQAEKIWRSNFRMDQDIVYLVRSDGKQDLHGFVINHPKPESLAQAKSVKLPSGFKLPPVYQVAGLNHKQLKQVENYEFEYPLGGESVFMLRYVPEKIDRFIAPVGHDWSLYVAHEDFHRIQERKWGYVENDQDTRDYDFSANQLALIALEDKALVAALKADSPGARKTFIQHFVKVRGERIRLYGQKIKHLDGAQERAEGTARYIEHRLGELLGSKETNLATFAEAIEYESMPEESIRDNSAFGRFYATGAGQARLLDLTVPGWKADLEKGATQYQLLAKHFPATNISLDQVKQAHDFGKILPWAKRAAQVAKKEPKDIFGHDHS